MPASRQAIATVAARLPPALSPATPTRALSPPNSAMRAITSRTAAKPSSNAPGKRVSGGRR